MRLGVYARMWDNPWFDEWQRAMLSQVDQDWRVVTNLEKLDNFDTILFTDSDDVPSRFYVHVMRKAIRDADIVGCAMDIIDGDGNYIGDFGFDGVNSLGFTNTCYRADVLKSTMPWPDVNRLDKYVAKTAIASGAELKWLDIPLVRYRRYGQETSKMGELNDGTYAWI